MRITACIVAIAVLLSCSHLCLSQQAPFFNTSKFDNVTTHRTNVCERQRALYRNEIELPRALEGLNLSVVLTDYQSLSSKPFFALVDGKIDANSPGTFSILMDEIARRAGFFWRNSYGVVLPIDSEVDGNRTWSDLLEWDVNVYDIAAGKWDRSLDRMSREISFPEGWFDASTIIVESIDNDSSQQFNFWSFLLPFTWGVWTLIVITVICSGLMYYLLERMNEDADELHLENKPGAAIFYSFITMTGHYEFRPQTTAARLLTFSLTFFALIIVAAYTANLVSFLVVRNTEKFKIESIQDAVWRGVPICVQEAVAIDEYISKKYPNANLVRYESLAEMFIGLKKKQCQIAAVEMANYDIFLRDAQVNSDCTLNWHGRVENIVPSGIATTIDTGILCTSLISYVLDFHLTEMRADGFVDQLWKDHLARVSTQNCDANRVKDSGGVDSSQVADKYSLNIKELAGIFIIHVALTGLSLLIALPNWYRSRKRRRTSQTDLDDSAESKVDSGVLSTYMADYESTKQADVDDLEESKVFSTYMAAYESESIEA